MPFLIRLQCQRGIDQGDELLRKAWRTAVADPLRIAAVGHEAGELESRHVAGHAGLAGAELLHQFTDAMLLAVPPAEGLRAGFAPRGQPEL